MAAREPPRSPTLAVSPALSGSGVAHDEPAEPPAPTLENLQRHAERLRARLSADGGFQVLVERPFVVIGDQSAAEVERWAEGTIRWAVRHLRRTYFSRDPPRIIEIWLLKDAASYQRQTAALLGREPHTPFGFYSPAEHVLVMNISTGGGTLVHEIVHPFIEANFPRCPPWFNEGLASLYEQCAERDGAICGLTNWRLKGLQQAIVDDELPSFEELCACRAPSSTAAARETPTRRPATSAITCRKRDGCSITTGVFATGRATIRPATARWSTCSAPRTWRHSKRSGGSSC